MILKFIDHSYLAIYEKVLDGVNNDKKRNIRGQINLF